MVYLLLNQRAPAKPCNQIEFKARKRMFIRLLLDNKLEHCWGLFMRYKQRYKKTLSFNEHFAKILKLT